MRVIGFDLDMTIVDSSEAIVDSVAEVGRRWGVPIDEDWLRATLGLPLDRVFPQLVPGVPYAEALEVYRTRYLSHGLAMHHVLPGVRESLGAIVDAGFSILVVSAKKDTHVRAVLRSVSLDHLVDHVVGERFAGGKSASLREHGAEMYVGDHVGDVLGARGAGVIAVAVATGPTTADELAAAGADVVMDDLTTFVPWWRDWIDGATAPSEETA